MTTDRRLPAEWETDGVIMLAWPHRDTDWSYMLDDVHRCYSELIREIARESRVLVVAPDASEVCAALADVPADRLSVAQLPTNDTWTRDYGPITVEVDRCCVAVDFAFNGWGLKFAADRDNLVTSSLRRDGLLAGGYENRLGFVLEGGSIESDGQGTILTTSRCLLSPNRNGDLSREQVEEYLAQSLGARRVLWLDHGYLAGDDTDSHIDTLARLAPHDTIFYVKCDDSEDEHYEELSAMERQLMSFTTDDERPYNLIGLPMPDAVYDEDGERLPATYANYLVTPAAVYVPSYGQPDKDRLARQLLQIVFDGRRIVSVDCRALIRQHGSLHCATMQIPSECVSI